MCINRAKTVGLRVFFSVRALPRSLAPRAGIAPRVGASLLPVRGSVRVEAKYRRCCGEGQGELFARMCAFSR